MLQMKRDDTSPAKSITARSAASAVALLVLSWVVSSAAADPAADLPAADRVRPELCATGFAFAGGSVLDAHGNLYAVNYRERGAIGRITPEGAAAIFCDLRASAPAEGASPQANGLKLDGQGRLIAADLGAGRLLRIAADGKTVEVLADRCEGKRFGSVSDVALDLDGNIYFTDPGGCTPGQPVGSLFRYDIHTAKVVPLDTGLAYPNGIAVTPDQNRLCVGESQEYRILVYELTPEKKAANRRVLIDFQRAARQSVPIGPFAPDGMVFDAAGRLYVAMWTNGVVNVIDVPGGNVLRQYPAGGGNATNCCFHDKWLYVAVAASEAVFRLKLGVDGFDYAAEKGGRTEWRLNFDKLF